MPDCSCSLCGREINDFSEKHFVVRFDVKEADNKLQPVLPDQDTDPLEMMTHLIMTGPSSEAGSTDSNSEFTLCSNCHQVFLKDPFGAKNSRKVRFSLN